MNRCTNNSAGPRSGAVLLELVLSVSLFLALVGGTFWIGELHLARNKLMVADRYAVWNGANRHFLAKGAIQGTLQAELFPADRVGRQRIETLTWERGSAKDWHTPFGATVWLRADMPFWTRGWLSSGISWTASRLPQPSRLLSGRHPEAADPPSHAALLARSRYGVVAHRTWTPKSLSDLSEPWYGPIFLSPWNGTAQLAGSSAGGMALLPRVPPAPPGKEYKRFGTYETWSR